MIEPKLAFLQEQEEIFSGNSVDGDFSLAKSGA
jgi:hypothetical protein